MKKLLRLLTAIHPGFFLLFFALGFASVAVYLNLFSSIRLDEAQSLWAATKTVPGILEYIAKDVHVPLYVLLLHFWVKIFGTNIVLLRLLSVLFFVFTIPLVFRLVYKVAGKTAALLTTSIFCLSPFLTWYSTETRMYTLLTFISVAGNLAFLKLVETNFKTGKLLYIFISIIGLYTHYFYLFILGTQGLYYLLHFIKLHAFDNTHFRWTSLRKSIQQQWRQIVTITLVFIGILSSLIPWILFVMQQGSLANTKPLLFKPTSYNIIQIFVQFLTGFQSDTVQSSLVSLWPLFVILLFFTFSKKKKLLGKQTTYFMMVTFIPILLAQIVSYTVQPILVSRYLIFVTPTLFYLLVLLLIQFEKKTFIVIFSVLMTGIFTFQYQQLRSSEIAERENYQQVAAYLTEETTASDIIAVSAPFTVYPIEYSYAGQARMETIPYWNRYLTDATIPEFTIANLEEQLERYRDDYQRMFVVLSYDQGYESELQQYLDSNLELEESRSFSTEVEVRQYRLKYYSLTNEGIVGQ